MAPIEKGCDRFLKSQRYHDDRLWTWLDNVPTNGYIGCTQQRFVNSCKFGNSCKRRMTPRCGMRRETRAHGGQVALESCSWPTGRTWWWETKDHYGTRSWGFAQEMVANKPRCSLWELSWCTTVEKRRHGWMPLREEESGRSGVHVTTACQDHCRRGWLWINWTRWCPGSFVRLFKRPSNIFPWIVDLLFEYVVGTQEWFEKGYQ